LLQANLEKAVKKTPKLRTNSLATVATRTGAGGGGGGNAQIRRTCNSIRKTSIFLAPGSDAMLYRNKQFDETEEKDRDKDKDRDCVPETSSTCSSPKPEYNNKTSEQDLANIKHTMRKKLAQFNMVRQMSFEEKENLTSGELGGDLSSTSLHDNSIILDELDFDVGQKTRTKKTHKPVIAWGNSCRSRSSSPEKDRVRDRSPSAPSGFKNRLVSAIARST
jgi:hypothetical protein